MKKLILILLTFCVIQAESNLNNALLEKFNKLTKQEIIIGSTVIVSSIIVWKLFQKDKSYSYSNDQRTESDSAVAHQIINRNAQGDNEIIHQDFCAFGITGVCVCG